MGSLFFFGSRSLGSAWAPAVGRVVAGALARWPGSSSFVGCASGGDSLALSALLAAGVAPSVSVFAVGSASGAGFWAGSALPGVSAALAAGASVSWLAGGPLSVALRSRLAARSSACVSAALAAGPCVALGFLSSPSSVGSLRSARLALAGGASVFCFCSFVGAPAAVAGAAWVPCALAGFASAWRLVVRAPSPAGVPTFGIPAGVVAARGVVPGVPTFGVPAGVVAPVRRPGRYATAPAFVGTLPRRRLPAWVGTLALGLGVGLAVALLGGVDGGAATWLLGVAGTALFALAGRA